MTGPSAITGLTGSVRDIRTAVETPESIEALSAGAPRGDLDLKRMAEWAMNYLIRTPRPELDYEPVFQCHPLKCPPVPPGRDVVVPCDTDVRLSWEWYYMRDISGSESGREVEAGFRKRILGYVEEDGTVLSHPGCYNEGDIHRVYAKSEYVYHIWGASKILYALAEDFRRTGDEQSRAIAYGIMQRLKRAAVYPTPDCCYLPAGMGALRQDGSVVPNGWNVVPAPAVIAMVNYHLATGDEEALDFAGAYAAGIMAGSQPGGLRFGADGNFASPLGHSHATMHAIWGIAHLGVVTGEPRYTDFARRAWDWMLTRGTGTGWFPAMPDDCNETCCLSDMMSVAALIARAGHPEYFDCTERYLRNYISNLQFILTPEFEDYYRRLNQTANQEDLRLGLETLKRFQGGIIGGSGLNDYENELLGRVSGFEMFGCCAPEGMRAIYTAWQNTIDRLDTSALGPAGVYVNLCFTRDSQWGRVVSFFPGAGRLTVKARVKDTFFLRPPHWAPHDRVRAFVGTRPIPVKWSGAYVQFEGTRPGDEVTIAYPLIRFTHEVSGLWPNSAPDLRMTFEWMGNMVTAADPPATGTPLFSGQPRRLPPAPDDPASPGMDRISRRSTS